MSASTSQPTFPTKTNIWYPGDPAADPGNDDDCRSEFICEHCAQRQRSVPYIAWVETESDSDTLERDLDDLFSPFGPVHQIPDFAGPAWVVCLQCQPCSRRTGDPITDWTNSMTYLWWSDAEVAHLGDKWDCLMTQSRWEQYKIEHPNYDDDDQDVFDTDVVL